MVLHGARKVRLAHDLRGSGINENIKFNEGLLLPQLRDVAMIC